MSINADATLVGAAMKMGQALVPADTSKIFQQQFQALGEVHKAKVKMLTAGIKDGLTVLQKKVDAVEFQKGFDQLSKDFLTNSGDYMKKHYESGKGPDQDSVDYAKKEFEMDIKGPLEELLNMPGERTYEQKAQIKQLERNAMSWKEENNNSLGFLRIAADDIANGNVDYKQSFSKVNEETGDNEYDPNMSGLYTQVAHPGINLSSVGVRVGRNESGQRGYFYDPNVNRTLQNKNLLSGQGDTYSTPNEKDLVFIPEEELFNGIVRKDKNVVIGIADIQMGVLEGFNKMVENKLIPDGQGGYIESKSRVLKTKKYSDISRVTEKSYLDVIMAPYNKDENGNNTTKRNVKTGLIYMSNNDIEVGGKLINYNEDSKLNPNITTLTYSALGLAEPGLSAALDKNDDGALDVDELSEQDQLLIHKKLMNPQTDEEVRVAAGELARYFNLQTQDLANEKRSNAVVENAASSEKNKSIKIEF
jgi:hypothetical protein